MGPGQKILTWVGSIFCGLGLVRSAIYGLGLNLENSPKRVKIFNFFPSGQKNLFGPGQRRIGILFTAGQKEAWVGSGQAPSLVRFLLSRIKL